MGFYKDQYIEAHERLIEEYLEKHPGASYAAAYDKLADQAYNRMRDNLADRADHERKRRREDGL